MGRDKVTVATFNCNSVRQRMEIIIEWLAFNDPDVLCLQETKVQDKDFPAQAFEETGYHAVFKGMKSYNGVAVLSKAAPRDVAWGFGDGGASDAELGKQDDARLIRARFGAMTVINTYAPQGWEVDSPKYAYKLEWFTRFKKYLQRNFSPRDAVLWVGDLNVAPEDMDVHDPEGLRGHVCFNPEICAAFRGVCEWGLTDVFRKHHPEPEQYSFWDYRGGAFDLNRGWRLDHLLATAPLAERCVDAFIDPEPRAKEQPSDHTFVVGVFSEE